MTISRHGRSAAARCCAVAESESPTPQSAREVACAAARIAGDERGAILLMGIFMCSCVAGMLWYVAGIGDAIVLRERLQSGTDAAALSAAVLHVKGMHLIVTLNYVMACILAIRVALRMAVAICIIVAAAVCWIPFGGQAAASTLTTVANEIEQVVQNTWEAIDNAISAVNMVQTALARIVPPAAIFGSLEVGNRYKPIVSATVALSPQTVAQGLPVVDGSEDKLCEQAGQAVGDLFFMLPGLSSLPGFVKDAVSGLLGDMVEAGGTYFCGLRSGGSPPDFGPAIGNAAAQNCSGKRDKLQTDANTAARTYWDRCNSFDPNCETNGGSSTLTPEQQSELAPLQADMTTKQQAVDDFRTDQCEQEQRQQMQQRVSGSMQNGQRQSGGGGGGKVLKPKKVDDNWYNGIDASQILGVGTADTASLSVSPRLVRLGAWRRNVNVNQPTSARFAVAQAEFFYDCSGAWTTNDCNGPNGNQSNAMWNYRWRARLRRFNAASGNGAIQTITGIGLAAEWLTNGVRAVNVDSGTLQNVILVTELGQAVVDPDDLVIH